MLALAAGASLLIAPARPEHDPSGALEVVRAGATVLVLTPLALARLLDAAVQAALPPGLRVLCRGDGALPALAGRALAAGLTVTWVADLHGTAGPVLAAEVTGQEVRWLPVAGTRAFIASEAGRELAPGLRGRLCLAGPVVADGYLRLPQVTDWQLDQDPEVRWVELGVSADGLACCVETRVPPGLDVARAMSGCLPDDAASVRLVLTSKLPVRPDGTVDVSAFLAGEAGLTGPSGDGADEATADLTADLVSMWQSVLGSQALGPDANFFRSGGDSMLAARLVAQIRRRHGLKVSLRTVFRNPTPARLAVKLAELRTAKPR